MSIETETEFIVTTNMAKKTMTVTFVHGVTPTALRAIQAIYDSYQRPSSGNLMVRSLQEGREVSFSNPQVEVPANWTPCHLTYCKGKIPPRDGKI